MSNPLRRTRKGDKAPAVRKDEFGEVTKHIQQLHYALVNNIYDVRHTNSRIYHLLRFLIKKGIISEPEYTQFLQEEKQKMDLAQTISKDESLSREQKMAKARENDIPEDWVVEPEAPKEAEAPESVVEEQAARPDNSSRIILPPGVKV